MTEETKGKKCICCTVAGSILVLLGLFADVIGIGAAPGFGYKQIIAIALGILLLLAGRKDCKCEKFCKIGKK